MTHLFDPTPCELGEGAFWHPQRQQFFWFDILGKALLTRDGDDTRRWQFDENVSAAGWIDADTLLIASETGLWRFDLLSGQRVRLAELEADRADTRSNDGRADPWGGFWIGTMSKTAEAGQGAIYRYVDGAITQLYDRITIPNAICFAPDKSCAYFADTVTGIIQRQPLDGDGWPEGAPVPFLDLRPEGLNPDGAVVDADGNIWNAQWGAHRVAAYAPDGRFLTACSFPPAHVSCPAFGGADLMTLFATTAQEGIAADDIGPTMAGQTFSLRIDAKGVPEPQVILP